MKKDNLRVGTRVRVLGADWMGTVSQVLPNGSVTVRLSDDTFYTTPPSGLALLDESQSVPQGRSADGKFTPGNKAARRKKSAHYFQSLLRAQLEPFLADAGTLIQQIDSPGDQVLALSRLLPYAMPKLAQVEYNENVRRNFTAEEAIARLNAEFHHLPDPTDDADEDDPDL
jgi:hypothetical protein